MVGINCFWAAVQQLFANYDSKIHKCNSFVTRDCANIQPKFAERIDSLEKSSTSDVYFFYILKGAFDSRANQASTREKSIQIYQGLKNSTFDFFYIPSMDLIQSAFDPCANEASTRMSRKIDRNLLRTKIKSWQKKSTFHFFYNRSRQLKVLPIHVQMKPQLEGQAKSIEIY